MGVGASGNGRLRGYRQVGPLTPDGAGLLATAPAICEVDWTEVSLHVVLAPLDQAARRRARAEATDLRAALRSLNGTAGTAVVPLFDHGADPQGRLVLVTARIVGTLADELAAEGPQPLEVVQAAADAAALGLDALHRAGLVHRGVAPAALTRRPDGRITLGCPPLPVLVEFAAATADGTGHEPAEVLSGGDWTPSAEVYALASTLWTLLAGRPPAAGSREQRLNRLLGGEPPQLRRTDVPDSTLRVLRAGLALDPTDRPAGPTELAALLTAAPRVATHPHREPSNGESPAGKSTDGPLSERERLPTLGSSHPIEPAPSSRRPLGSRYLLEARLGAGTSGTVWKARRRADATVLAAKLLHPHLAEDRTLRARLLTEQATLLRLSHPNLVTVHDLVAEAGELAIVMDLVDGEDLRTLLSGRSVGRAAGLRLLAEVAAALAAVHASGVVHRDVKPENVLVARGVERHARLTDFGLAKALDSPSLTRHSQLLGTPDYMAPELIAGRPAQPAADVYSLGIMIFEVLAGRRPFHASNTNALQRAHLEQAPPRPAGLPEPLWQLVAACLSKDPARRPTAGQVADALSRLHTLVADDPPTDTDDPIARIVPAPSVSPVSGGDRFAPVAYSAGAPDASGAAGQFGPHGRGASAGDANILPTAASTRPPPHRPASPRTRRRRRWPLVTAVVATAVLGLTIGAWLALYPDRSAPAPGSELQARYTVPVTATVGGDGQVILSWSTGAEKMAGFSGYLVLRDNRAAGDPLPRGQATFVDVAARSGSCYHVIAVGVRGTPPDPPPPACPTFADPS